MKDTININGITYEKVSDEHDHKIEVGQRYINKEQGDHYILANLGQNNIIFINVDTGNRLNECINVENVFNITNEEFKKAGGHLLVLEE